MAILSVSSVSRRGLEMDSDPLYLALAKEKLYLTEEDCILPENNAQWLQIRRIDCRYVFVDNVKKNFFPRTCCAGHKNLDKRETILFKKRVSLH